MKPLARLILPVAVTRNLFTAPLLLFIFGTFFSFYSKWSRLWIYYRLLPNAYRLLIYFGVNNIDMFLPSNLGEISSLAISWT